jgi:hypothetical protein
MIPGILHSSFRPNTNKPGELNNWNAGTVSTVANTMTRPINLIAAGQKYCVVVTNTDIRYTSSLSSPSWAIAPSSPVYTASNSNSAAIGYGDGKFVAAICISGNVSIYVWDENMDYLGSNLNIATAADAVYSLTYHNDATTWKWVLTGRNGSANCRLVTDPLGTWSSATIGGNCRDSFFGPFASATPQFIFPGGTVSPKLISDGSTVTNGWGSVPGGSLQSIACGDGVAVAVNDIGNIYTAPIPAATPTWTARTSPFANVITKVKYIPEHNMFAIQRNGDNSEALAGFAYSTNNGVTWTSSLLYGNTIVSAGGRGWTYSPTGVMVFASNRISAPLGMTLDWSW